MNNTVHEKTKTNQMDYQEQVSLFSRLLEIVIRHALTKKHEENANLNNLFTYKPGSE
jgi:hypothetical protein